MGTVNTSFVKCSVVIGSGYGNHDGSCIESNTSSGDVNHSLMTPSLSSSDICGSVLLADRVAGVDVAEETVVS